MTWPITPNPGIHQEPASIVAANNAAAVSELRAVFARLEQQIFFLIINAILNGLGLGSFTGTVDQALLQLQTEINNLLRSPIGALQSSSQQIIDNIANALGIPGTGNPVSTVLTALENIPGTVVQNIPNQNVVGQIANTIGADIQGVANVLGGLFGSIFNAPAPTTYAAMNNYVGPTALQLDSAINLSNAAGIALAAQAISNPSSWGVDPTASPVFHLTTLSGASATTVPVTVGASAMGFIGTPNATIKKSIAFLGYYTGGLESIVLNLYSVNTSTGQLTFVFSSGNIVGQIGTGSTPVWNYYNFTSGQVFMTPTIGSLANTQAVQTDWYGVEMVVVGTGTFNLVGLPNHWLPANSNVFPSQLAASRTAITTAPAYGATGAGTTAASGNSSYTHTIKSTDSALVVWIAFGYTSGTAESVKCGSTTMTLLTSFNYGTGVYIDAWGLLDPPAGAQTISITAGTDTFMAINSVSYGGVSGFGTPVTASGNSAALAQTVTTAATTDVVAQAFASVSGSFSGYNQTARSTQQWVNGVNYGLLVGDAPGAASVSFTANYSVSAPWGSVAIPLHGNLTSPPVSPFSPTYSANVPWFALCGSAGISEHAPQTASFLTAGSFTYIPPAWAQQVVNAGGTIYFDLVGLGGGGSGQFPPSGTGYGGGAGVWNTSRLTYTSGSTIPATMSVTVGAGGASVGLTVSVGVAGGNSSVSATGITTLTAAGGGGGDNPYVGNGASGGSPGNSSGPASSPLGLQYTGGTGGNTFSPMPAGSAPGAGGAGGFVGAQNLPSGAGASGAVFITCYQGAIGTAPGFVAPKYYVQRQQQIATAVPRSVMR